MKKLTAATAIILILSLVLTSLTAFAAPAEVTDYASLLSAVSSASSGDTVELVCSGDLESSGEPIDIPAGVTLKLSAASGGASIDYIDFCGEGKLELDTANFSFGSDIFIYESVEATINGDLSGLSAYGSSKVTVNGNIKVEDEVGEIHNTSDNQYFGSILLDAGEMAEVKINGSVIAATTTVTVKNYDMENAYIGIYGDVAVSVNEKAKVEISGDVIGGNAVLKYDTFVASGTLIYDAEGGNAIEIRTVGGSLVVGGNVVGGNAICDATAHGGNALAAGISSIVKIGGDVTGGKAVGGLGEGGNGISLSPSLIEDASPEEQVVSKGNIYVSGTVKGGKGSENEDGASIAADGLYYGRLDSSAQNMTKDEFLNFSGNIFGTFSFLGLTTRLEVSFAAYSDALTALVSDVQDIMVEYLGEEINYSSDALDDAVAEASEAVMKEMIGKIADKINAFSDAYIPASVIENGINCDITVWALDKDGKMFAPSYTAGSLKKIVSYINRIAACDNGRLSVSVPAAKAGETVEVTPIAETGYKVSKVFLCGNEITPENGKYTFTVEDGGAILLSAEFVADPAGGNTPGGNTPGGSTVTPENPKTADGMTPVWFALLAVSAAAILLISRKKAND